jgi:multiple sugar transport system ATP-binding protein
MTVFDNMAFALKLRKTPKAEIKKRVTEAAKILDIEHLLDRKPKALSGGQRQRVAMGRAIVRSPKVFLMDEPLSNLDAKLRVAMRTEIKKLHAKLNTTFIYVTHDQTEAMTLGDRIVIMKDGFIMQVGTPTEVFDMPDNLFVAEFIGAPKMNTFKTNLICENGKYYVTPYGAKIEVTGKKAEMLADKNIQSQEVILGVRPEHFKLSQKGDASAIPCKITVNEMMGSELHLHVVEENGDKLIVRVPTMTLDDETRKSLVFGETIYVTFEGKVMHFFNPETEKNLLV